VTDRTPRSGHTTRNFGDGEQGPPVVSRAIYDAVRHLGIGTPERDPVICCQRAAIRPTLASCPDDQDVAARPIHLAGAAVA
jgi:hypothetical protein